MPSQGRGRALKNKNTGSKNKVGKAAVKKVANLKVTKGKPAPLNKSSKKSVRKVVAGPTSTPTSARSVVGKERTSSIGKVSLAERISQSKLVKSAAVVKLKNQRANLKLVSESGSKIPVSKITRSSGPSNGSASNGNTVVHGRFGSEMTSARPVLAVRQVVEKAAAVTVAVKTSQAVNFKLGDKIVYPGHGVGEIEGVRTTVLGGEEHHIYNIKILDSGMKVMVPVSQAAAVGLRRIIDKKAIDTVYDILRDRNFKIDTQTWNRRFREYSQKIKTGSVFEIAVVLRDLSVLSSDKELSFGEKKMLDMAEALLVSEIAIAKARPHDKVAGELKSLFV
jgi:CarD family transcriptional regulator